MKVLVCGGHVTPALAVIQRLPKGSEVLYVGRKHALEGDKAISLEYQTITTLGIPFITLHAGKLQRKFTRHTFSALLKTPYGLVKAFHIVRKFHPDVIVGFGGYVQTSLCLAAFVLKIPIILHEQTLEAGLANRLIAPFAEKICISWESSFTFFPKDKTVLTGNPISQAVLFSQKPYEKQLLPTIVVMGGSLGSHAINVFIEGCIRELVTKYKVIHQTGDAQEFSDFDRLSALRLSLPADLQGRYTVTKFIDPDQIVSILSQADLVISRAGINSITTLLLLHKPSLIIPLPVSSYNEQYKNAVFLQKYGLAQVVNQSELNGKKFFDLAKGMIEQNDLYKISEPSKELLAQKDAADTVVSVIYGSYTEKKHQKEKN